MPRRREVPERQVIPDPKYSNKLVSKFINSIMIDGKKSVAESILYGAFNFIEDKTKEDPVKVFEKAIEKINEIQSVLAKAMAANLLIAYLQPFEDGNKRTSRMLGNAILLAHGFLPLSFSHTPKEEYIKSILYFYEKQDPRYFMYLFLKELNYSFREYIG